MPENPASSRPAQPAAVSTLVAEVVHGPVVDATVVGAHRYAVYLAVGRSVLPVVTSDAVPLPTAVRLAVTSATLACNGAPGADRPGPWGVAAGDVVPVGRGRIALPGLDVVAARAWRPARVRHAPLTTRDECGSGRHGNRFRTHAEVVRLLSETGAGGDSGWLVAGIHAACSAVGCSVGRHDSHLGTQRPAASGAECGRGCQDDHFRTHGGEDAVAGLVGRGPGLTPSGDDALAGALLVASALGTGTALADAVRARLGATTAVSAALLDAAADGYAARPVVDLVDAAVAGDADAVARALPAVLAIGHTSGADTVLGIRTALAALSSRGECGNGCQSDHFRTQGENSGRRVA